MSQVTVLGCGRIGAAIAIDLKRGGVDAVLAVDINDDNFRKVAEFGVQTLQADFSDEESLSALVGKADIVVSAAPSIIGFAVVERLIALGKPLVDISFYTQDPLQLDTAAKKAGVSAIVDCGLAPGLSNLTVGHLVATWDRVDRFVCEVGGLPMERRKPFEYAAPFAPDDVIEEYLRPARIRRAGENVVVPALSEVVEFVAPGIGTLESFLTDGLRTLLSSCDVPELEERTVRYPGHAAWMKGLRDAGFFSDSARPHTARVLRDAWAFAEGELDLTVMRIQVSGQQHGQAVRFDSWLIDHADVELEISSMARTTGYTAAAAARWLLAHGETTPQGVLPPERLATVPDCYDFLLADLADRGVLFQQFDSA